MKEQKILSNDDIKQLFFDIIGNKEEITKIGRKLLTAKKAEFLLKNSSDKIISKKNLESKMFWFYLRGSYKEQKTAKKAIIFSIAEKLISEIPEQNIKSLVKIISRSEFFLGERWSWYL